MGPVHHTTSFEPGYEPVVAVHDGSALLARVGVRPGVLRIEAGGSQIDHALQFDPAGRLISAQSAGRSYRRTLDNRLLVSRIVRGPSGREGWSREPAPEDPLDFLASCHRDATRIYACLHGGATLTVERGELDDPRGWLRLVLEPAVSFDEARLVKDTECLSKLYLPIPILPPDQYGSLVLQATEGCSYNRCGFCDFYAQTPYRERDLGEFTEHVTRVVEHYGDSLDRIHRVFLGQANALLLDTGALLDRLAEIRRHLPLLPKGLDRDERAAWLSGRSRWIDGVYSFIDGFHRPKTVDELRLLADAGIRRVYLGLESGSDEVLEILAKPKAAKQAAELARRLHETGIPIGVIVLVGAGGVNYEDRHVEETLALLAEMELRRGDQVYLSRMVIHDGSPYADRAAHESIEPVDANGMESQVAAFRQGFRERIGGSVPVAPYDISLTRSVHPGGSGSR